MDSAKIATCWLHNDSFSQQELVVNPDFLPDCMPGDLIAIEILASSAAVDTAGGNKQSRLLLLQVAAMGRQDPLAQPRQPQLQISIHSSVASAVGLLSRQEIRVRRINDPSTVAAQYVELTIRDQYIGRADMFRLKNHLVHSCVHLGKRISFAGCIRAQVKEINILASSSPLQSTVANDRKFKAGQSLQDSLSAFVTAETKFVFRSESAKYFIFIQISQESFTVDPVADEASGGEEQFLIYEKSIYGFLPELFERWRSLGTNHVVSIVLFARVLYDSCRDIYERAFIESGDKSIRPLLATGGADFDFHSPSTENRENGRKTTVDGAAEKIAGNDYCYNPTHYKDFYKVVVDWETRADWNSVIPAIKRETFAFYQSILEQTFNLPHPSIEKPQNSTHYSTDSGKQQITRIVGKLARAVEGNLLEAVNLALNIFDKHYIDRDLLRTGLSIVIVTASNGLFKVPKRLLRLTTERMIEDGIGLDLVCLRRPPLFYVPCFEYYAMEERKLLATTFSANNYSSSLNTGQRRNNFIREPSSIGPAGSAANHPASSSAETDDPLYLDGPGDEQRNAGVNSAANIVPFYNVPYWIDISFYYSVNRSAQRRQQSNDYGDDYFPARCSLPLKVGVSCKNERSRPAVRALGNHHKTATSERALTDFYRQYDERVRGETSINTRKNYSTLETNASPEVSCPADANEPTPAAITRSVLGNQIKSSKIPLVQQQSRYTAASLQSSEIGLSASLKSKSPLSPPFDRRMSFSKSSTLSSSLGVVRSEVKIEKENVLSSPQDIETGKITSISDSAKRVILSGRSVDRKSSALSSSISRLIKSVGASNSLAASTANQQQREIEFESASYSGKSSNLSPHNNSVPVDIKNSEHEENEGRMDSIKTNGVKHVRLAMAESPQKSHGHSAGDNVTSSNSQSTMSPAQRRLSLSSSNKTTGQFSAFSFSGNSESKRAHFVPWNPGKNIFINNSQMRRWHHVFPQLYRSLRQRRHRLWQLSGELNLIKWKSLCTPACLPLTTDYFPSMEELTTVFQEYTYTVSLNDEDFSAQNPLQSLRTTQTLLMELIAQRLVQGFQLVSSEALMDRFLGASTNNAVASGSVNPQSLQSSAIGSLPISQFPPPSLTVPLFVYPTPVPFVATPMQTSTFVPQQFSMNHPGLLTPYYLSLNNQIHRLAFDPSARNVEVKRYVRKTFYSNDPVRYTYAMWPKHRSSYTTRSASFSFSSSSSYHWNYLDHVVSGYQEELTEALRFWRTRFILIPNEAVSAHMRSILCPENEQLTDEELRLAGFLKFIEVFHRAAAAVELFDPLPDFGGKSNTDGIQNMAKRSDRFQSLPRQSVGNKKNAAVSTDIPITFTTFNASAFVANELSLQKLSVSALQSPVSAQQQQSPQNPENFSLANNSLNRRAGGDQSPAVSALYQPLDKTSKIALIATEMQHPVYGARVRDRRWHLRFYEKVFVGSEFVDWLVQRFVDIDTREDALQFGNDLMKRGLFDHVNRKHAFLDGHYFYTLNKDWVTRSDQREERSGAATMMRWFRSSRPTIAASSAAQLPINNDDVFLHVPEEINTDNAPLTPGDTMSSDLPAGCAGTSPIQLSRKLIIDVDPQRKSYRRELATLHYDCVHNPQNCYHFHLHWLVCTARLVEDMLQSWSRVADRYGMRLVEAPVEQASLDDSGDNPFHSPVEIKLCVQPPSVEGRLSGTKSIQLPAGYFEIELVKRFGFLLDIEADARFPPGSIRHSFHRPHYKYTQYVHRSGMAFIQLREPGQPLLWVNNRLLISHSQLQQPVNTSFGVAGRTKRNLSNNNSGGVTHPEGPSPTHPDSLRKHLQSFCANQMELSNFWDECLLNLTSSTGLAPILDDVVDEQAKRDEQLVIVKGESSAAVPLVHDTSDDRPSTAFADLSRPFSVHRVKSITVNVSSPVLTDSRLLSGGKPSPSVVDSRRSAADAERGVDSSNQAVKRQRSKSFQSLNALTSRHSGVSMVYPISAILPPTNSSNRSNSTAENFTTTEKIEHKSSQSNSSSSLATATSSSSSSSSTSLLASSSWLFNRRSRSGSSSVNLNLAQQPQTSNPHSVIGNSSAMEPNSNSWSTFALWKSSSSSISPVVSREESVNTFTVSPPVEVVRSLRSISSPSSPISGGYRQRQQTSAGIMSGKRDDSSSDQIETSKLSSSDDKNSFSPQADD